MSNFNPNPDEFPLKRFAFPWRSVHLPVVPAIFDNSLSLLEVTQKMLYWINETIGHLNDLNADLISLKAYVDTQDAATLTAANAYAVALRDALKEYVDTQDAATLAAAQEYAIGLRDALKEYVDTQDAATLAAAKTYADGLRNALKDYVDTQDAANLAAAKTYADGLVSTLRAYVDTQLGYTINYINNREQTIREDMAAMFYTIELASSQVTTLPTGIDYSTINQAAANGKLVRVHVVAENWWYYYAEPCRFFRGDVDNAATAVIIVSPNGQVLFDDFN